MAPARLNKIDDDHNNLLSISDRIEAWLYRHASLCLFIVLVMLFVLFVMLIWLLTGVSATESGAMRNFVNGGYV